MAYFSKEIYERKTDWALNKQLSAFDDAIENGLTEEQFELLMRLASFRHELHCNSKDCFYCESANYDNFMKNLDADFGGDDCLCYQVQQEFGTNILEGIHLSRWCTDTELLEDDTYSQEDIDEELYFIENEIEKFNSNVKHLLVAIDIKYKTSFSTSEYSYIANKEKNRDTASLSVNDIYHTLREEQV